MAPPIAPPAIAPAAADSPSSFINSLEVYKSDIDSPSLSCAAVEVSAVCIASVVPSAPADLTKPFVNSFTKEGLVTPCLTLVLVIPSITSLVTAFP